MGEVSPGCWKEVTGFGFCGLCLALGSGRLLCLWVHCDVNALTNMLPLLRAAPPCFPCRHGLQPLKPSPGITLFPLRSFCPFYGHREAKSLSHFTFGSTLPSDTHFRNVGGRAGMRLEWRESRGLPRISLLVHGHQGFAPSSKES